jgi:hypothetical protein
MAFLRSMVRPTAETAICAAVPDPAGHLCITVDVAPWQLGMLFWQFFQPYQNMCKPARNSRNKLTALISWFDKTSACLARSIWGGIACASHHPNAQERKTMTRRLGRRMDRLSQAQSVETKMRVDCGGAVAAAVGAGNQIVAATDGYAAQCAFCCRVIAKWFDLGRKSARAMLPSVPGRKHSHASRTMARSRRRVRETLPFSLRNSSSGCVKTARITAKNLSVGRLLISW